MHDSGGETPVARDRDSPRDVSGRPPGALAAAASGAGRPSPWPTFIHKREGWQAYGLPGGRAAGFRGQKVAQHNGGKILPSTAEQDGQINPDNRLRVI
jgi:hypothetical protein